MNRLSGKTAVVTGASKGIGAGIAKGLAAEGAAVVVTYASSKAGVYNLLPLEEVTEADFHRHFNINVLGLLLATKEAAKLFGDAGGSVINIGSAVTELNSPNTVVYTATKA